MKRIAVLILALSLAGCAGAKQLFDVAANGVVNPVTATSLYEAELVFDATIKTFVELRGLCANRTLPSSCRTYVIKGQKLVRNAAAADIAARNFVANNPTLDATNVIGAFTGILSDFKTTVTSLSATK